jgi:hypothetical protein
MAQNALVESLIEDGRNLLEHLNRTTFPIAAAWWVKEILEDNAMMDRREWQFFLASPLVDQQGSAVVYQKIYEYLRGIYRGDPILPRFSLGRIKAVGVNDAMTVDVLEIIKLSRGKQPICAAMRRLGNIVAEEVYIYPPPLPLWEQLRLKTTIEVEEPLSQQEHQAVDRIVASGINPVQAGYLIWKKHEEAHTRASLPAGSVVSARIVGAEGDPDPLLLVVSSDGKTGLTRKSNSEPVPS